MKRIFLMTAYCLLACTLWCRGQGGSKYGPRYEAYIDSIRHQDYKWKFPIWGKRLAKRGFDLTYPVGIMINGYAGSQKVNISDLKVGFNGGEMVPLDFVKFGDVQANIQSVSVRPDLWVLPFMDIYAIAGTSYAQTKVTLVEPMLFSTEAKFTGTTFGLGTTLAGGYHGIITIIDINHTWTRMSNIDGTIQTTMFTPRLGYNFLFPEHPGRTLAVWVGTMGCFVNRTTEGTINLADITSDVAKEKLQEIKDETAAWYQQLTPAQKAVVKPIAEKLIDKMDGIDVKDATISYSLKKRPVSDWSLCLGAQLQLNHRWQMRTEVGFLGGRSSLLLSGNYRFRW
jgi:hypothetical protein